MAIDERPKSTYDGSVSHNTFTNPDGSTKSVKVTETVEYDANGQVVKKTVVTETVTTPPALARPWQPNPYQPYWTVPYQPYWTVQA